MREYLLFLAGVTLLTGFAWAQTDLDAVKRAGVWKVGTEGTYPPFTFHDAAGKLVGFDVEIALEVGKKLGLKTEFVLGKWDGLLEGLDQGHYDAVVNEVTVTAARKAKYEFSADYVVSRAVLIVRSDNSGIRGFSDVAGKQVGQSLTSNFARLAESNGAKIVAVDGFNQSIDLLLAGRIDATFNDSLSYFDYVKQKPGAKMKVVASQPGVDPRGIVVRKGELDLVAVLNRALADLKSDGTYAKISQKYFGADVSK